MGIVQRMSAGIKTTPVKFLGSRWYINLNATALAKRADDKNKNIKSEGLDNLIAQMDQDARLGSYYGIYAVRYWNLSDALKKLSVSRRRFFILQYGDGVSEYTYLAIYWGHESSNRKINSGVFKNSLARYLAETAIYSGKSDITSAGKIKSKDLRFYLNKKRDEFEKSENSVLKALITKESNGGGLKNMRSARKKFHSGFFKEIVNLAIAILYDIQKGGATYYVPDQKCIDGMIRMEANHNVEDTFENLNDKFMNVMTLTGLNKEYEKETGSSLNSTKLRSLMVDFKKDYEDAKKSRQFNEQMELMSRINNPQMAKETLKMLKEKFPSGRPDTKKKK